MQSSLKELTVEVQQTGNRGSEKLKIDIRETLQPKQIQNKKE